MRMVFTMRRSLRQKNTKSNPRRITAPSVCGIRITEASVQSKIKLRRDQYVQVDTEVLKRKLMNSKALRNANLDKNQQGRNKGA